MTRIKTRIFRVKLVVLYYILTKVKDSDVWRVGWSFESLGPLTLPSYSHIPNATVKTPKVFSRPLSVIQIEIIYGISFVLRGPPCRGTSPLYILICEMSVFKTMTLKYYYNYMGHVFFEHKQLFIFTEYWLIYKSLYFVALIDRMIVCGFNSRLCGTKR
jgi:hypothetical protein